MLARLRILTARWLHLVSTAKVYLFKKRKRYAELWRTYRVHAQEAAQMRCARVRLSGRQGFLLQCLALSEWRKITLLGHMATSRCRTSRLMWLLTSADGVQIGDGILGRQDFLGTMHSSALVCRSRSVKLLWKRLGFEQWNAVMEDGRKEGRRRQALRHLHVKKMVCSMMLHWERCNLEASCGTQRQRLLFSRYGLICIPTCLLDMRIRSTALTKGIY